LGCQGGGDIAPDTIKAIAAYRGEAIAAAHSFELVES
jgi:hypothetical protein